MRTQLLAFLITLATCTILHGQDGSDILYTKVDTLDGSYLGDFVHLDFHNRSFRGIVIDTVTLLIGGKPIAFVEHRTDNGYNNWFDRQYLVSLEKTDGLTIRVVKCRLDKITDDSVFVTGFLQYYKDDKILPGLAKEIVNEFSKSIIAEVLVSAGSHRWHRVR